MIARSLSKPKVSVLVTTYNHERYIEQCLNSLVAQKTDFSFEILVGEDCSTDHTREIIQRVAENHPDIIRAFFHGNNQGVYANSTFLRDSAIGEYTAICEGDDYWHRDDKLQKQVDLMESDPGIALVCSDVDVLVMKTGRRICAVQKRTGQWCNSLGDLTRSLISREVNIFTCTALMRRADHIAIRNETSLEFSTAMPMGDVQLWWELSRKGKIVHIEESLATYRVVSESASHSQDPEKEFSFYSKSLQIHEHYVRKYGYSDDLLQNVRFRHFWMFLDLAVRHPGKISTARLKQFADHSGLLAVSSLEMIALFAVQNERRFRLFAAAYPYLIKSLSLSKRVIQLAIRKPYAWGTMFFATTKPRT